MITKKIGTKVLNKENIVEEMPVQSFICKPRQNGTMAKEVIYGLMVLIWQ